MYSNWKENFNGHGSNGSIQGMVRMVAFRGKMLP